MQRQMMKEMQVVEVANGSSERHGGELCREVEDRFKPYVGQEFLELEEAVSFYKIYAIACGFDVRKYSTKRWRGGDLRSKLLVCNREGFAYKGSRNEGNGLLVEGNENRRNRVTRVGCRARIRLFIQNGLISVDRFHEGHNHQLVSIRDREFQKLSRNITDYHKMIIVRNSRLKIGATKTYKICKEHVNGFENIGARLNDFKNFHRDVKCFIHERDGQMFIDHFRQMAETREGFYFDYEIDDDGSLCRAIWADSTARNNYALFGDGMSFDPTYSTNMYSMVFTPFTGVDNHGKSVTFCGALIAKEDFESFNWVFSRFLHAIGGKEPSYIITDQDPGIIKSVPLVFKTARHRFCMWHIMNKVPNKFGVRRSDYSEFIKKMNNIVWDEELEAEEFDAIWAEIMAEHGLGENDWFADIFAIRKQWVMAHCRDLPMAYVMRTTQRSESENSFFKTFEDKSGTLVEFWIRFQSAMDQQRHTQKQLDYADQHSSPKISTHLPLEKHAAKVYTYAAFDNFRDEAIHSVHTCRTGGFVEIHNQELTTVKDSLRKKNFGVTYSPDTFKASCSCRMFETSGILCRHILWIYSSNGIKTIPDEYVLKRWTKYSSCFGKLGCQGEIPEDMDIIDPRQIAMSRMWSEFQLTVGLLEGKSTDDVAKFAALVRDFRKNMAPSGEVLTKNQEMGKILNCTASDEVTILPPKKSKNKGSGKRMLSNKAKAVVLAAKPKRLCNNCKRLANHDKRNCPNPFAEHPPSSQESSEQEDEETEEEEEELDE